MAGNKFATKERHNRDQAFKKNQHSTIGCSRYRLDLAHQALKMRPFAAFNVAPAHARPAGRSQQPPMVARHINQTPNHVPKENRGDRCDASRPEERTDNPHIKCPENENRKAI